MKLKVNNAGLPIQLSPVSKSVTKSAPSVKSSIHTVPSPSPENEFSRGVVLLWSSLTLFLNSILILVSIMLTLYDILDLETDSKVKLVYLPEKISILLTDWTTRFPITVIGFMLSVVILVLERNANYQSWAAVISLLWFPAQISHLSEISNYFPHSELFIFKCILSASLTSLSLILFIFQTVSCVKFYYQKNTHKPRDVRSINPNHRELVQSFKENNEIISSPPSKNSSPESSHQPPVSTSHDSVSSLPSVSHYKNLTIKPDSVLRKRLAGLSIDKDNKVKHCTTEDEPFDLLLEKLGTDLRYASKNMSFQRVDQQTNWISSGFWSTRCYGNEMSQKEGQNTQTSMFASFSASWSRFISDGSGAGMSKVTQKMVKISNHEDRNKSKCESTDPLKIDLKTVVQPSKLNLLPQIAYK